MEPEASSNPRQIAAGPVGSSAIRGLGKYREGVRMFQSPLCDSMIVTPVQTRKPSRARLPASCRPAQRSLCLASGRTGRTRRRQQTMQPQTITTVISRDEYLAGERESHIRHEYVDGEVYAMVGASDRHGLITLNLAGLLSQRLPDRCQVFSSDMKVRIQAAEREIFYYPDVLVSCDPRDRETYYRQYPCLVIEVLSPHTARLDRFEKSMFYRQLDSLEEYLLVSQDYRQVEVLRRSDQWHETRYNKGEVQLQSVALALTVDEIYRRTDR
jgi:Uma2 family endonuclease